MTKPFMILNLPIEPIPRRYSILWNEWFEAAFKRNGLEFRTVKGVEVPEPSPDKFLDPKGTFLWKQSQLMHCLPFISSRDVRYVVFLHDGWMPGMEMFPYLRDMDGYDIKVASYWHAGSYDSTDLLALKGSKKWAVQSEISWQNISDMIFIATNYHRQKMPADQWFRPTIEVVGSPVEVPKYSLKKENLVVWPHRLSEDKHPEVFERLSKESCFEGVQFVRTMDQYRSKQEYYELLARSKVAVSTATHENFGIAMVEAAMLGCFPVVPRGIAYDETMSSGCFYTGYEQLVNLVRLGLEKEAPYVYPFAEKFKQENVTDRVCKTLRRLGEE